MTKRKRFFYTRGANFVTVFFFGAQLTVPWFYRRDALIQQGYDKGWTAAYKEYSAKASGYRDELRDEKKRTAALEAGVFELLEGEVITMSRARELLGKTAILPVRERYQAWLYSRGGTP